MVDCQRGDVVSVAHGELSYTAVVVQSNLATGNTVVICPVTDRLYPDPMDIMALLMRLRLLRRAGRGRQQVKVVIDKPVTIARVSVARVGQRLSDDQM